MSVFSKLAAPYRKGTFLNSPNQADTVVGGAITASPANYQGSQLQQNFPGDRFLFSSADALAASNNTVGNLYGGAYRFVEFRNNSTSNPIANRGAFWDPTAGGLTGNNIGSSASDMRFMVTTDGNAANYTNTLLAGICIANQTLANGTPSFWFIQESGKATVKFIATLTGTGAIAVPVFVPLTAAANSNATDNGAFDVLEGANSATAFTANSTTAYTQIGQMIRNFVGVAETAPSNNNTAIVDLTMQRTSFRMTPA